MIFRLEEIIMNYFVIITNENATCDLVDHFGNVYCEAATTEEIDAKIDEIVKNLHDLKFS